MKRHPALIPISREHHHTLILAKLLQKDTPAYKGMPNDAEGKANYALDFYKKHLIGHFIAEEKILSLVKGIDSEIDRLSAEIIKEHYHFHISFTSIINHENLENQLDILGKELELHIRKEERLLFPLIQEKCSEDILNIIAGILE